MVVRINHDEVAFTVLFASRWRVEAGSSVAPQLLRHLLFELLGDICTGIAASLANNVLPTKRVRHNVLVRQLHAGCPTVDARPFRVEVCWTAWHEGASCRKALAGLRRNWGQSI